MSIWEFLVIVLVALLVLGPERMYRFAVVLGRMTRHARRLYADVKAELDTEFREEEGRAAGSSGDQQR